MQAYGSYGMALVCALAALGQYPSIWAVVAANTAITLIAALVPFPGGTNAVSSVGLAGALVAMGVPQTSAVGAVLVHQLLTQYLQAVPGWLALRNLLANDNL